MPDAGLIAIAVERVLRAQKSVGTMADYLAGDRSCTAYKLYGTLRLEGDLDIEHRGIPLKIHGVPAKLRLTNSEAVVSLMLAFDNIAGLDFHDGHWSAWESGAMWLLKEASSEPGYPLVGQFTPEASSSSDSCGVAYFINVKHFEGDKERLEQDQQDTITAGVDQWPVIARRYY